jgi:hypothetical protein
MSKKSTKKPHGQIRQGQLITTFGPGSMIDLPKYSVLVAGLDHWTAVGRDEIHEPRLVQKLKALLDVEELKLQSPPRDQDDQELNKTGITVWQFPEWFITQDVEDSKAGRTVRSRMLIHRKLLTSGRYVDEDKRKHTVVPVRFVRACRKGHISDIDWSAFVHRGPSDCKRQLWMDETGTSGDLSEITIRCECKQFRRLYDAANLQLKSLGGCDGTRPWLGPYTKEKCGEPNRLLVRTASNAYFPQIMSVISLPDRAEKIGKAVSEVWDFLESADSEEDIKTERKKAKVKSALDGLSDREVFEQVKARKGQILGGNTKPIKLAEIETLLACKDELGEDTPDGNFFARNLPDKTWRKPWMKDIERVVLVHRLREVTAQVGFTRFEVSAADVNGELEMGVVRATLAREIQWLPAIENRGEGVFIAFKKDAVDAWLERKTVALRGRQLSEGFAAWLHEHSGSKRKFMGLPYIMLHTFSHLLITAVALECGYPASSIRERVYASSIGYGILLHTGSQDAEGTLGGLVEVGRRIHQHINAALELARLCSNDPVCAQHEPSNAQERRFLSGASCHGCVLIAETSCEQHNEFLDRALVVPTLNNLGAEFFTATE